MTMVVAWVVRTSGIVFDSLGVTEIEAIKWPLNEVALCLIIVKFLLDCFQNATKLVRNGNVLCFFQWLKPIIRINDRSAMVVTDFIATLLCKKVFFAFKIEAKCQQNKCLWTIGWNKMIIKTSFWGPPHIGTFGRNMVLNIGIVFFHPSVWLHFRWKMSSPF